MMRYLHIQAHPIIGNYAAGMFNDSTYSFQPDETVPIIDVYDRLYTQRQALTPAHPFKMAHGINCQRRAAKLAQFQNRASNLGNALAVLGGRTPPMNPTNKISSGGKQHAE
jgi:hypothetical protein